MSTSQNSPIEDGLATYGRTKAVFSFIMSIIISICLMVSSVMAYKSNKNKPTANYIGIVQNIINCNRNNCNVAAEYYDESLDKKILINTTANLNVRVGDSVEIQTGGQKGAYILGGISITILVVGILYYRYVMSSKYAAIENAMPSYGLFNRL